MHRLRNRTQLRIRIALHLNYHTTHATLIHRKTPPLSLPRLLSYALLFGHLNSTPALLNRLSRILTNCIKRLLRIFHIPSVHMLVVNHIPAHQDHGGGHDGHGQLCR